MKPQRQHVLRHAVLGKLLLQERLNCTSPAGFNGSAKEGPHNIRHAELDTALRSRGLGTSMITSIAHGSKVERRQDEVCPHHQATAVLHPLATTTTARKLTEAHHGHRERIGFCDPKFTCRKSARQTVAKSAGHKAARSTSGVEQHRQQVTKGCPRRD